MMSDGTPDNRVELQPARSPRVLRHLAIGILFGVGLFIVVGGIYNLSYDTLGGAWVLGVGLLVLFGAEVLRRANVNQQRPGAIEISEEKLSIECPAVLRGPIEVELGNVSVAATSAATADGEPGVPVYGYSDEPGEGRVVDRLGGGPEWLPVRSLGPADTSPDAILLFESPVAAPEARRSSAHGPRSSEALGGIAVCLAEPEQARRVFESFGLRSRIREDDLERLARIATGEIRVGGAEEAPA